MKQLNNNTHIYGFEEYNIVSLWGNCFYSYYDFRVPWFFERIPSSYIINKDLPVRVYNEFNSWCNEVKFDPSLYANHKELLSTAKKLYVHQNCKLSRSMLAEKYKKSLNPWLSDAVVVPEYNPLDLGLKNVALFIHEQSKTIIKVALENDELLEKTKGWNMDSKFSCFATGNPSIYPGSDIKDNYILDAKLFYIGEILHVPNSYNFIIDILTNSLPTDKIVSEKSIQESLSSNTNQLAFDSITSIKDMLDSSDENTVAAGLKALSMMDWMHYPNSIKYILDQCDNYRWKYNKAADSTSVKYMMKTISKNCQRRHWPGRMDDEIYEQDYELFKQLKMHYEHILPENIMESLRFNAFMTVSNGILCPRLKEKDI